MGVHAVPLGTAWGREGVWTEGRERGVGVQAPWSPRLTPRATDEGDGGGVCSQKLASRPSLTWAWRHVLGSAMPLCPLTHFSLGVPGARAQEGGAHPGRHPAAAHHQGPITRLSHVHSCKLEDGRGVWGSCPEDRHSQPLAGWVRGRAGAAPRPSSLAPPRGLQAAETLAPRSSRCETEHLQPHQ